ncbi:MAG: RNA polymerase factor sigma-54 [Betaproteobacteria bacterium]|nr:MAG: RNA polymerase factor sigma-54 [Betaproteobacteria bacterium]
MKTGLQLKLAQHLTLTPQLQQSIRLLQLSTLELQQEISTALAENPLLELEDSDDSPEVSIDALVDLEVAQSLSTALDSDERGMLDSATSEAAQGGELGLTALEANAEATPFDRELAPSESADTSQEVASPEAAAVSADADESATESTLDFEEWGSGAAADGDDSGEWQQSRALGLREFLLQQVPLLREGETIVALIQVLIESLNDDGFLDISCEETARLAGLPVESIIEDWQYALSLLQSLEPTGVGARDLRECLLIQLQDLRACEESQLAFRIVRDHFDLLSQRDYVRIRKIFGASEVLVRRAITVVQSLNPRPGAAFADVAASQLVPDIIVRRHKTRWVAELNGSVVPRLVVNQVYADMLQRQKEGRATPLSNQLQEARWLVKNVAQRFDTILRVASEIVERQQAFFDHGPVAMRPLVLREVADALGLHESTVSRVTTQKYLTSVRGTFEFKYFFGSHVATDAGGAASSTAIRAMIKTLISEEDTANPLSDSRIAELLGEQGIIVARRTVAKYREQQGLDPVNLRKR